MQKLLAPIALLIVIGVSAAAPAEPNQDINKQTETSYTPLSYSNTITAENAGDSAIETEISRKIPVFILPFTTPEPEPDQRLRNIATTELIWNREIQTGEASRFGYTFHYWIPVTLLAFFLSGIVLLKRKITRKKIVKTGKKDGDRVKIMLDISNRTDKPMENVEIYDFVPEMLEVVEEFETMEPELEQTDHGTRLRWDIGRMESDESRVLTYKVESGMEVESEIILRGAEIQEDGKKTSESDKVMAEFTAKEST